MCELGYTIIESKETCGPCAVGKYVPFYTRNLCIDCPQVTYSNTVGYGCTKCDVGKYQDITGSTECKDCPANSWSDLVYSDRYRLNAFYCSCNYGYYRQYGTYDPACIQCDPGKYSYGNGLTDCMAAQLETMKFVLLVCTFRNMIYYLGG